jgi:hypothetical protein
MIATETIETKTEQIVQLESEISSRNADIQNLTEALATLEAGRPRPQNPKADDAFSLLKELVGSAPQDLEQQQVYQAKLAAAQTSLKLAVEICDQKRTELKVLRDEARSQQQAEAFEQLKSKASRFNSLIDEAMAELEQMRELRKVAGSGTFEVVSDIQEIPYCSISSSIVRIRRRFDIRQG